MVNYVSKIVTLVLSILLNASTQAQYFDSLKIVLPFEKPYTLWDLSVGEDFYIEHRDGASFVHDVNTGRLLSYFDENKASIESGGSIRSRNYYFDSITQFHAMEFSNNELMQRNLRTKKYWYKGPIELNPRTYFEIESNEHVQGDSTCYQYITDLISNHRLNKKILKHLVDKKTNQIKEGAYVLSSNREKLLIHGNTDCLIDLVSQKVIWDRASAFLNPNGTMYNELGTFTSYPEFSDDAKYVIIGDHLYSTTADQELDWFYEWIAEEDSLKSIIEEYGWHQFCRVNRFHPSKNIILSSNGANYNTNTELIHYNDRGEFIYCVNQNENEPNVYSEILLGKVKLKSILPENILVCTVRPMFRDPFLSDTKLSFDTTSLGAYIDQILEVNYGSGRGTSFGMGCVVSSKNKVAASNGRIVYIGDKDQILLNLSRLEEERYPFEEFNEERFLGELGFEKMDLSWIGEMDPLSPAIIKDPEYDPTDTWWDGTYNNITIVGIDLTFDNKLVVTGSNNKVYVSDLDKRSSLFTVKTLTNGYPEIAFVDQDHLVVPNGNSTRIFSMTGDHLLDVLWNEKDYVILLPNGYYTGGKALVKSLYYVSPSLEYIDFEQLDLKYNRPDVVLKTLDRIFGSKREGLIKSYSEAYEKRVAHYGAKGQLEKSSLVFPEVRILNRSDLLAAQTESVTIQAIINSVQSPVINYNVLVNGVTLYGTAGFELQRPIRKDTVEFLVRLGEGENRIEIQVTNEQGFSSFSPVLILHHLSSKVVPSKIYFVGVGVNEFIDDEAADLSYCVKDVQDLSKAFYLEKVYLKLLLNKDVTRQNVLDIRNWLLDSDVNDRVIVHVSTHGVLSQEGLYLAMHDTDFSHPEQMGLKYDELLKLFDSIPARKRMLLLDACNSGELDLATLELKSREQNAPQSRAGLNEVLNQQKDSFDHMLELFVNTNGSSGVTVISAAGGKQAALEGVRVEGESIKNGVFTYCVLDYLTTSDKPNVYGLGEYVMLKVPELSKGSQTPFIREENLKMNWTIR